MRGSVRALATFAAELGAPSPVAAMRLACQQLRARIRADRGTPGLRAYLRAYGLRVEEGPIPTAGRLDYEDGRYVIRVQRTRHREETALEGGVRRRQRPSPPTELPLARATDRQRFTIAHEIGHAILFGSLAGQPDALADLRDPALWAEVEALCDVAARELLVPLDELLPLLGQLGVSLRGLERLAGRFRVAREVIHARLMAAGALGLSAWRVGAGDGDGVAEPQPVSVALERVLAHLPEDGADGAGHDGALVLARASTAARALLLEAAQQGYAQAPTLTARSSLGEATVAAIATCHAPLTARAEQPSLLNVPPVLPSPPTARARGAALAQVTLLLLPSDETPLWQALARE